MAIKLVVDSTCDMLKSEFNVDYITIMPVRVYFGDKEFIEGINITKDEFFDRLITTKECPTTSQANVAEMMEVFSDALANGDQVLGIFISSKLSGTYNSACLAAKECGNKNIAIVDSSHASIGFAALVEEAIRLIEAGLQLEEISMRLEEIKGKIGFYCILNDLFYLKKSGRLNSNLVYLIASTLRIKPILSLKDGEIVTAGKALGFKRACHQLCDLINESDVDTSRPFYIGHAKSESMQDMMEEYIVEKTQHRNFERRRVGLSTGSHSGPECTGVAYFKK